MTEAYRIDLPQFEGPFDLLLFFIERDELDIRDIPIAKLTDDFLQYVQQATALDLALAGEFIVVAATLMSIKARVLLPRLPRDEEGNEVDPRAELADRLLEYKRYKDVLADMRALEVARSRQFGRGLQVDALEEVIGAAVAEAEWESVTLFKLFRAFEGVLERQASRGAPSVHRVVRWPYTVEEESARVLRAVVGGGRARFETLFGGCRDRVHAIVTFLAVLDLVNGGRLRVAEVGEGVNGLVVEGG